MECILTINEDANNFSNLLLPKRFFKIKKTNEQTKNVEDNKKGKQQIPTINMFYYTYILYEDYTDKYMFI